MKGSLPFSFHDFSTLLCNLFSLFTNAKYMALLVDIFDYFRGVRPDSRLQNCWQQNFHNKWQKLSENFKSEFLKVWIPNLIDKIVG